MNAESFRISGLKVGDKVKIKPFTKKELERSFSSRIIDHWNYVGVIHKIHDEAIDVRFGRDNILLHIGIILGPDFDFQEEIEVSDDGESWTEMKFACYDPCEVELPVVVSESETTSTNFAHARKIQESFKAGEIIEVSNDGEQWFKRKFSVVDPLADYKYRVVNVAGNDTYGNKYGRRPR